MIYDVIIIGGGASGISCALTCANAGLSVAIVEKNEILGKKLLSTGNGRCNLTNKLINMSGNDALLGDSLYDRTLFNTAEKAYFADLIESDARSGMLITELSELSYRADFINSIISKVSSLDICHFFDEMGIKTESEGVLIYPSSFQAKSFRELLELEVKEKKVQVFYQFQGKNIEIENGLFKISLLPLNKTDIKQDILAKNVVISTGGKAAPKTGSTGDGYYLAGKFGHSTVTPYPALCSLKTNKLSQLKNYGIRVNAKIKLVSEDGFISADSGILQLSEKSISGIPAFMLSRYVKRFKDSGRNVKAVIDFCPEIDEKSLSSELQRAMKEHASRSILRILTGFINDALAKMLLFENNISANSICSSFSEVELTNIADKLANIIKEFTADITDTADFDSAQVTTGGIDITEINEETMESRLQDGLYFTGEVIDIDGACGGYNLHFAWATGIICGRAISSAYN